MRRLGYYAEEPARKHPEKKTHGRVKIKSYMKCKAANNTTPNRTVFLIFFIFIFVFFKLSVFYMPYTGTMLIAITVERRLYPCPCPGPDGVDDDSVACPCCPCWPCWPCWPCALLPVPVPAPAPPIINPGGNIGIP
ncbi:hypothetical protein I7I50_08918 [Histoplasma capsulatum G186AR]|uniref:Uncharacterized protein n=1 Tax=Ajellomyces capsulatus TaxID=5037 RepID=A0A8H7YUT3_AJECA|nr:hypothetical protein I7I52_06434 [Histoplasma capsulatum]QSS73961.1 hypothetical protein I7I50_08918 [Histoplasma capsulatum G186AR]